MSSKPREPFDWVGLLFLIELSLFTILFFGSVFRSLSDSQFVAAAIAAGLCAGAACQICYRKARAGAVHQWWTAMVINALAAMVASAVIYLRLQ